MENPLENNNAERIRTAAILEKEESAGVWISDAHVNQLDFSGDSELKALKKPRKVQVVPRSESFKRNLMTVAIKLYKQNEKLS